MKATTELVNINEHVVHVELYQRPSNTESIIMVNGALATTASFTNCVKYLQDDLNVILFDLPFAGQSKPHNPAGGIITKDDEVNILLGFVRKVGSQATVDARHAYHRLKATCQLFIACGDTA